MDTTDLHKNWKSQETDSNLIVALFKESKEQKIEHQLSKTKMSTILFTIYNIIIIVWSSLRLFENFGYNYSSLAASILLILSLIVFFKNIKQISKALKVNNTMPIVEFQKNIEDIKILRIKHNRFLFVTCVLYFWVFIIVLFQIDANDLINNVWVNAPAVLIIHIIFLFTWFPLSIWILKQYDKTVIKSSILKRLINSSMLTDKSINISLNQSLKFLREIQAFENEKG